MFRVLEGRFKVQALAFKVWGFSGLGVWFGELGLGALGFSFNGVRVSGCSVQEARSLTFGKGYKDCFVFECLQERPRQIQTCGA